MYNNNISQRAYVYTTAVTTAVPQIYYCNDHSSCARDKMYVCVPRVCARTVKTHLIYYRHIVYRMNYYDIFYHALWYYKCNFRVPLRRVTQWLPCTGGFITSTMILSWTRAACTVSVAVGFRRLSRRVRVLCCADITSTTRDIAVFRRLKYDNNNNMWCLLI